LTIDISSRDISINNIFLGGDDNLWIDSKEAKKVENTILLKIERL